MDELSRRKMLMVSGGGVLGALGTAAPAQAAPDWTWDGPSVAGTPTADPRWVWDSEADPLLASVVERGDVPKINQLLRTWVRNDQPLPAGLPQDVRAFMEQARRLPPWADQSKLDGVRDFIQSKGTYLLLAYGMGGGMLSCAIPKEARAVYYSKGGADMRDRVAKTTKFGVDAHDLNAYQPAGDAVVSAVKTRLVHAAVRHLLPQSPHWVRSGDGQIPISQNEMLVTWHTLPTNVMRKLTEWGVRVTPAESESFLHLWQVTAHMLGIRDEFIPASWQAAYAQSDQILGRAMAPSPEGVKLANILVTLASEAASPGGIARPLVNALNRYVVGNQVADWVEIPREPTWDALVHSGFPQWVAMREGMITAPLAPAISWTIDEAVRKYMLFYFGEGKEINIEIPDANRT